ncbi:MAG: endopeptidase La [Deltaproteobacteria bacterium RIFOXYA12_FULL_61_11]|nr:MAG: endopeptidase La [Deltaproteobacteria bacterium RIFOXYA12_FULL_61_11]
MIFKADDDRKSGQHREVPLLPLRDIIIFPYMVVPLFVGRDRSIAAIEEAMNSEKDILLVAQKKAKVNDPEPEDIYRVGTLGTIIQLLRLPDNTVKVLIEGKRRARVLDYLPNERFFHVEIEEYPQIRDEGVDVESVMRETHSIFESYVKLNNKIPPEMLMSVTTIDDPSRLADTIVAHLSLKKIEDKQEILEIASPHDRLQKLNAIMQGEIEILQVEKKIKSRVKKQMEKTQKEFYLNEQMQAIQKELGDKDEVKSELQELEERIKQKALSKEADQKVGKELKKLKMMMPMSAEATVVRNYIDWILSLPWNECTEDKLDINEAETILNEDHYGLKQVKERILEYLAVQALVDQIKGPILCFAGPPGVGKTSLGHSIARAMGRKFVRISLGGVRDEAEIRGHRRTYIGAMPGKIIQSLKKAGTDNPVFLLDEVDKMSMDFRGDPSSALLEVLDPEQNHTFNDHYLDLDYDLSKVMFITTANNLHNIPRPLHDRMEIIPIAGYTEIEKLHIAKRHLLRKEYAENGLYEKNISFTDNAITSIVRRYTRESGVRSLEREIAAICRKVAKEIVKYGRDHHIDVTTQRIQKYLGIPRYRYSKPEEQDEIGLTNGLAWTEVGGELLVTEVSIMPGKGKLTITGKLGDVMQESAQAAMSYVRTRSKQLGLPDDFYQNLDLHIHVPEGAIPKDGPSAGITMATSLISALTKIPVRKTVAMTGEITLRGRVLPIGGLKEKLMAAQRARMKSVCVPKDNRKDIKEIPKPIISGLQLVFVDHMDEVMAHALDFTGREELLKNFDLTVPSSLAASKSDLAEVLPTTH